MQTVFFPRKQFSNFFHSPQTRLFACSPPCQRRELNRRPTPTSDVGAALPLSYSGTTTCPTPRACLKNCWVMAAPGRWAGARRGEGAYCRTKSVTEPQRSPSPTEPADNAQPFFRQALKVKRAEAMQTVFFPRKQFSNFFLLAQTALSNYSPPINVYPSS